MASQSQVVWEEGTDPPQLVAAALPFLVERILDPNLTDPSAAIEFLLVFPSFTTGAELLSVIATRWQAILDGEAEVKASLPPGIRENHELVKFDVRKKKIIDFLHLWIFDHWIDFRTSPELQQQLQTMLKERMVPNCPKTHLKNFTVLLAKKQAEGSDHPPRKKRSIQPPPLLLRGTKTNKNSLTVNDLLPEEIARQITIRESELYGRINVRELIRQAWNKKGQEERCKYIIAYIGNFNRISFLVQTEVLRIDEARQRAVALGVWITVAEKCRDLKNYNAVMEIISALGSSSISRLSTTWAIVSEDRKQALAALQQLTKRTSNFKELRVAMDGAPGACVPYIGMYLSDLTFIEDGNMLRSDFDQSLVHYSKWKLAANVIQKIQSLQRLGYVFEELPSIQMWLASGEACDEKTLYQMSLQLEARGSSDSSRSAVPAQSASVSQSQQVSASGSGGSVMSGFVRRIMQKDPKDKDREKDSSTERSRRKSDAMSISMPIGRAEVTTIIDTKLSPRGINKQSSGTPPLANSASSSNISGTPSLATSTSSCNLAGTPPLASSPSSSNLTASSATPSSPPSSPPTRRPVSGLPPVPPSGNGRDKSPMPPPAPATTPGSPPPTRPSPVPSLSLSLTSAPNPAPSSSPRSSPRSAGASVPPPSPRSTGPTISSEEETVTEKPDLLLGDTAPETSTSNPDVSKCAKCAKPVEGAYIVAEGKPYHNKCFTCTTCHVVLDKFVSAKVGSTDQFFCMEHSHLANPMPCAVCQEHIKTGEPYFPVEEGEVHARCFKCSKCQQQLKQFVKVMSQYFCSACAEKQEQDLAHLRHKPLPPAPGKQPRTSSHTDLGPLLNKDKTPPDPGPAPTPPRPSASSPVGERKVNSMTGTDTLQRKKSNDTLAPPERTAGSLDSKEKHAATAPATPEKDKEAKKESSGGLSALLSKTKKVIEKKEKEKPPEEPPAPKPDPGPPTGKNCTGCGKAIFGSYNTLSSQPWHPTCLKCNVCQLDLIGQSILVHEGKLFCKEHYEKKAAPRCAACNKGMTGAIVAALDKQWHKECLVCYKCKKDLTGGLYQKSGKPSCAQHAS